MKISLNDVKLFLGMNREISEDMEHSIRETAQEVEGAYTPRYIYRCYSLEKIKDGFLIPEINMVLSGNLAKDMLSDCDGIVLLACTVGSVFDSSIRREQVRDLKKAVIMDACGSALAESGCDEAEKEIASLVNPKYLTDRFSAGYGDLPLSLQPEIASALDMQRKLGIYVDDSFIMNPAKSVTAFIGISDRPQRAKIRGCDFCALKDTCALRGKGKSCAD